MDREKEWSLIVEDANTQLHLLLKSSVVNSVHKEFIKSEVLNLITKTSNALKAKEAPIELVDKTSRAIKLRFVEWYNTVTAMILKEAKKNPIAKQVHQSITTGNPSKAKPLVIDITGNNIGVVHGVGTIDNVPDYVTTQTHASGQAYMDDYVSIVKKTMQTIASKNLVMRDKNGRKLSVRNLAEMTARFEDTKNKLQELKDKNIQYVVASSHANASGRCQIWQGKLFELDVDPNSKFVQNVDLKYKPTPKGKLDGIDYYSLADAMQHGFLGYNCRHRLVKYTKGMDLFKQYPVNQIERERKLELKQRHLERQIRKCKQEASMAVTPEDRKMWTEKSKEYQKEYHDYCHSNGLTEIPWRTRISRDERNLNIDYDGDGPTYSGNSDAGNFLFYKVESNVDITPYTKLSKPSNKYSWQITTTGKIHALESHKDLKQLVPNLVEEVLDTIMKPVRLEVDTKYKDTVTFYKKMDINHILRVSVLIREDSNKIKSVRYQSIKKKEKGTW